MSPIRAVAFDLFNTLITVAPQTLEDANARLLTSLSGNDFSLEAESFAKEHRAAAIRHIQEARESGRETHNSVWISAALGAQGHLVPPDDKRIAMAVDAYFSAFLDHCRVIPGTKEMLTKLRPSYSLGLLSNFTHGPAARKILSQTELDKFFEVVIISGELGYRKPHLFPFLELVDRLRAPNHQVVYVGDDPEPDIFGSRRAGLQPVWSTYVRDSQIPFPVGALFTDQGRAEPGVPTISNWDDLLSLLAFMNDQ